MSPPRIWIYGRNRPIIDSLHFISQRLAMISLEKLRQYIERLEYLDEQKTSLMDDISDTMAEAKGEGFDVKVIRQVLKIRKMKPEERNEQEELLHLYLSALRQEPSRTNEAA